MKMLAKLAAMGLALSSVLTSGCSEDSDACEGRAETCLSLTLYGSDGVSAADQLRIMLLRKEQPLSPMTPLSAVQDFPFKVAVLWPDGPANLSVRSSLSGMTNGVSAEISLDLRNGQHAQRKLTLYPPLPNTQPTDMARPRDMAVQPDLAVPPDMTVLQDMAVPPDLTVPADLATSSDLAVPPAP